MFNRGFILDFRLVEDIAPDNLKNKDYKYYLIAHMNSAVDDIEVYDGDTYKGKFHLERTLRADEESPYDYEMEMCSEYKEQSNKSSWFLTVSILFVAVLLCVSVGVFYWLRSRG